MRVATFVITVLLVWALPSATSQAGVPDGGSPAGVSAVKKPGLAKALKKCRAIRKAPRRKACVRKARKRFRNRPVKPTEPVPPKPGTTWRVDVMDDYFRDYFSPDVLEIKAGDSIEWNWSDMNQNPHDVTLFSGPAGVDRADYKTPNAPSRNYTWTRRLDQPGTWEFVCSLHFQMKMTVTVER